MEPSVPSENYQAALKAFTASLHRALIAAGKPSLHDLEDLSDKMLSRRVAGEPRLVLLAKSTSHGILQDQRTHPPKWPWVLTFVTVLREAARDAGTDPERIGSVTEWKERHEALCAAEQSARQMAGVGSGGPSVLGPDEARLAPPQAPAERDHANDAEGDDALSGEVLDLVRRLGRPQWWHPYQDLVPDRVGLYLNLESVAEVIRVYTTQAIPGLLQAEPYAHALTRRLHPGASEREIARHVELRLHRQRAFADRRSGQMWAIVEEAALRNQYLDTPPMRAQLRYLIELTERPNIRLQILRSDSGDNDTIKEPLTVFRFCEPDVGDVAFLGPRQPDGLILQERENVQHCNQLLSRLGIRAASTDETAELLSQLLGDS